MGKGETDAERIARLAREAIEDADARAAEELRRQADDQNREGYPSD